MVSACPFSSLSKGDLQTLSSVGELHLINLCLVNRLVFQSLNDANVLTANFV